MNREQSPPGSNHEEDVVQNSLSFVNRLSEEIVKLLKWPHFRWNAEDDSAGPRIRVIMHPNELVFLADLPGLHKEDLKVQIDDRLLIIEGQPQNKIESQEGKSAPKSFCRCLELPEGVNSDETHAKFRDGVLEVKMPLEL